MVNPSTLSIILMRCYQKNILGRYRAIARLLNETTFGDFTVIPNVTWSQMHNVQQPFPPRLDYIVKVGQEAAFMFHVGFILWRS